MLRATLTPAAGAQVRFLERAGALLARGAESARRSPISSMQCSRIERTRFRPEAGRRTVSCGSRALTTCEPRRCIMVEDTLENLRTAKKLGMKTVWVSREPARAALRRSEDRANLSELRRALRSACLKRWGETMARTGERKTQILQTLAQMLENPASEKVTTACAGEAARSFRGRALPPFQRQGADVRRPDRVHRADAVRAHQQDHDRGEERRCARSRRSSACCSASRRRTAA